MRLIKKCSTEQEEILLKKMKLPNTNLQGHSGKQAGRIAAGFYYAWQSPH